MTQDVTVVQTRHGDFGNQHFEEGRECRKDTKLVGVETESSGGGEVATLHDTGGDKHFRVLLVDDLETR